MPATRVGFGWDPDSGAEGYYGYVGDTRGDLLYLIPKRALHWGKEEPQPRGSRSPSWFVPGGTCCVHIPREVAGGGEGAWGKNKQLESLSEKVLYCFPPVATKPVQHIVVFG